MGRRPAGISHWRQPPWCGCALGDSAQPEDAGDPGHAGYDGAASGGAS